MSWDDFRIFLAVARAGRVSTAAKQLGVEHTTVSRRLAAFEEELGGQLFYRTAAGYKLTPQGESALPRAEAMERAAFAARARVQEGAGKIAGRVRLALLEEYASHWLAPHLPAFYARHPALELELLIGPQPLDLSRGEADIAVRTPRPRQVGLTAVRLGHSRMGLYASRALLGGRRLNVESAASLRGLRLLVYTSAHHALQSAAWFQPVLSAADVVLRTNSTETLVAAARSGLGIAVVPRLVARNYDDLVPVSADVASHDVWLVSHPELRRDPKVRATSAFLRRLARGHESLR